MGKPSFLFAVLALFLLVPASMNASPAGNGTYTVHTLSASRTPLTLLVRILPLLDGDTYNGAWWTKHLIEMAKSDTSKGKVILSSQDSTGTWYIFYKDAKCVKTPGEKIEGCHEHLSYAYDDKTKKGSLVKDGKYFKFEFMPWGSCKKGTEYCTEMLQVFRIDYIYSDKECTRLIDIEKVNGFSCL